MERMTRVLDTGNIWPIHGVDETLKKLAAYENTGLEPSEIQPIKHGHWFIRGGNWCCSACNKKTLLTLESNIGGCREYGTSKTDYCPNCGAKMEVSEK